MVKLNAPKSLPNGGGDTKYLDKPGTFHLLLTKVAEGEDSQGNVNDDAFSFTAKALAGTVPECEDGVVSITLYGPTGEAGKEKRDEIADRAQTAFCFAANLLREEHFGGSDIEIDASQAVNAQIMAKLVHTQKQNAEGVWEDTKFLKVSFDDIFHVDDPKMAEMPKDAEAIGVIADKNRYKPELFEKLRAQASQDSAGSSDDSKTVEDPLNF